MRADSHRTRRVLAVVTVAACAAVAAGVWLATQDSGQSDRQQVVAERGAAVMPFDLEATTHVFEPSTTGGVQSVVADDPTDADQVELVRDHLRREEDRFRAGDFGDPTTIHGEDMPGITVLQERYERLDITYRDVSAGGELTFRSADRTVVAALHDWFDAQLVDHGDHAEPGGD